MKASKKIVRLRRGYDFDSSDEDERSNKKIKTLGRWNDDTDEDELSKINDVGFIQETLPDHLIVDQILPRLPVKSVVRFKAVCKNWLATLSSPTFAKTHLKFSSLFPVVLLTPTYPHQLFKIPNDDESVCNMEDLVPLKCQEIDEWYDNSEKLIGSCNGILCFYIQDFHDLVALWNPATHEYLEVELYRKVSFNDDEYGGPEFYGFGYASSTDDYKIIFKHQLYDDYEIGMWYLFSLKVGTWRICGTLGEEYYTEAISERIGVYVDDYVYWPLKESEALVGVAGFDLVNEEMKSVAGTQWLSSYAEVDKIFEMKGCLSLCCRHKDEDVSEVWMLKQEAGQGTWQKVFSIDLILSNVRYPIIGFTGTGKYLELEVEQSNSEDNGEVIIYKNRVVTTFPYVESLVTLENATAAVVSHDGVDDNGRSEN